MVPKEYVKYNNKSGNWAGYDQAFQLQFCGWMDCHNDKDSGATQDQPYFEIKVKYAVSNGRLIYQEGDKIVSKRLRKGMVVKFDATKDHAFLHKDIADACVASQKFVDAAHFEWTGSTEDTQVRLVWEFIDN
jgi:hypothetical protein